MRKFHRFLGWMTLGAFLTGCSGYRTVRMDPEDPEFGLDDALGETTFEPGRRVKVVLTTDEEVAGQVVARDDECLTVASEDPDAVPREIPYREIDKVVVYEETGDGAIVVATLALAVLVVGGIAYANAMDDFMDWGNGR